MRALSAAAASAFSVAAAVTGLGCLMLSLDPGQAVAVCGPALGDWTFDAWITAPLALSATLYGIGAARLALRSPRGLSRSAETLAFVAGWLALALALVSPLHRVGERLFTAHMIEHEIVMAVAAPLIVLARPAAALLIMGAFLGRADYCLFSSAVASRPRWRGYRSASPRSTRNPAAPPRRCACSGSAPRKWRRRR